MNNKKKELVYICSPLGADTAEGVRLNMLKAREQMEVVSEIRKEEKLLTQRTRQKAWCSRQKRALKNLVTR